MRRASGLRLESFMGGFGRRARIWFGRRDLHQGLDRGDPGRRIGPFSGNPLEDLDHLF
jgi:hypothetical protein